MGLTDYLRMLRKRAWRIAAAGVLVAAVAFGVSSLQEPTYRSEVTVLLTGQNTASLLIGTPQIDFSNQTERVQTQVKLMQLRPLATQVVKDLRLPTTADELLERVTVSAVGETNLVTLEVTDSSAKGAAAIANTLAGTYVSWSRDGERSGIRTAAEEVERRLQDTERQIAALRKRADRAGSGSTQQTDLQVAMTQYAALAEKREGLRINEQLASGAGSVVASATVDPDPVSPKPVRNSVLGLAVGLMLGVGLAVVAESADTTMQRDEDVEKEYGVPVLARIPVEKAAGHASGALSVLDRPHGGAAEAYRILRTALEFVNFQHDIKVVLVASAAPGEGKSSVAANLAAVLAQAGKRVVLVVSDLRRPTADRFFDLDGTRGLSEVLAGKVDLQSALQPHPTLHNLWVLPSGPVPPNPSEMVSSAAMERTLNALKAQADCVIVDSPPLLAVADAAATARWSDGVLVVVRGGVSKRDMAKRGRELLERSGARVLGAVVWGVEPDQDEMDFGVYYTRPGEVQA